MPVIIGANFKSHFNSDEKLKKLLFNGPSTTQAPTTTLPTTELTEKAVVSTTKASAIPTTAMNQPQE